MKVRFHKLDERRYTVSVITDNGDELKMPSAPGQIHTCHMICSILS